MESNANDDVFTVVARRCKRCGGLLTSKDALRDGYGHTCLRKNKGEEDERKGVSGQINLFDNHGGEQDV